MIIDSHCHLHDPAFADAARHASSRATELDVWGVVAVGLRPRHQRAHPRRWPPANAKAVWPALGFHPGVGGAHRRGPRAVEEQVDASTTRASSRWARSGCPGTASAPPPTRPRLIAAGPRAPRAAARPGRALRPAGDRCTRLTAPPPTRCDALKRPGVERAVFHWHKAPLDVTRAIVDAGYLVSVTPEVVYRERDRELVEAVPLDSLLVESDGPWPYGGEFEDIEPPAPGWSRGWRRKWPRSSGLPVDETMYQLSVNTCRLFDLVWALSERLLGPPWAASPTSPGCCTCPPLTLPPRAWSPATAWAPPRTATSTCCSAASCRRPASRSPASTSGAAGSPAARTRTPPSPVRIADLEAVLAHLATQPELDGRFGLLGSSLGGFVALWAASRVAAGASVPVVTWNAPAALRELAARRCRATPGWAGPGRRGPGAARVPTRRRASRRLLVIQGEARRGGAARARARPASIAPATPGACT